MLISIRLRPRTTTTPSDRGRQADVQRDHPGLDIRQAGDLTLDDAINDRVGEDLSSAEGAQPADHAGADAAGVRRADRGRHPGAARRHQRRRHHRHHRAALAPGARESTVTSMILLIGMAVGVDYSLFYLKREREERARAAAPCDAVEIAAQTSGHSILVSGGAVIAVDGRPVRDRPTRRSTPSPSAPSWSSRSRCSARSRCSPRCWPSSVAGSTGPACRCSGGSTAVSAGAASAVACSVRAPPPRCRAAASRARRRGCSPCRLWA